MVGVSVHIFLIIRANLDPMINEAAPKTWTALWEMLIRDQYKPPPVWMRKAELPYQLNTMWLRYMWWNFSLLGPKAEIAGYGIRAFLHGLLQPPILLAIAGAWVNLRKAPRTGYLLALLFVLLGPAMAFYLNFRVGEVRERDYFFVQNFVFLSIWVGIGAAWFVDWVRSQTTLPGRRRLLQGVAIAAMLLVSIVPLFRNFDSHDRRGFYVARDYAYNMLVALAPDAIIFTNGDNDTFPLWYLQEVEGVRKDVRVVNLSLLNTPWYIRQLRDLEPKVDLPYTDAQVEQLRPFRNREGKIMLVKDIAVKAIIEANRAGGWSRPLYLAVTVPDQMGLRPQLQMEGLVFRIYPEPVADGMNLEKTMENLMEVYRYDGLVLRDPDSPNGFGAYDSTVYKDENSTKLVQNYAAAFSRVGVELYEAGRPEEGLEYIDRAQAISPYFAGIAVVRGIILENLGRTAEAEEHYREMMRVYPNDWQLLFRMGDALSREGKLQEAIPYFMRSIEFAPGDQFYPYQGLASAYYQMGLYQEAANVLQRWLILHPEDQNVRPLYEQIMRSIRRGVAPGDTSTPQGDATAPR
jgi:tetratricopeptide (TPR) repeat protein